MNAIHSTREDWLTAAIDEVRPMFAAEGLALAPKIRVACGFPAHHARSGGGELSGRVLGVLVGGNVEHCDLRLMQLLAAVNALLH